jgi:hypothetical protein
MEGLQVLRFDPKKVCLYFVVVYVHSPSLTLAPESGLCTSQSHRMEQVARESHDMMPAYDTTHGERIPVLYRIQQSLHVEQNARSHIIR